MKRRRSDQQPSGIGEGASSSDTRSTSIPSSHSATGTTENDPVAIANTTTTTATKKFGHRIAFVCDFFYPRLGGVEMHIWSLAQHLIRQGHKVILITHAYKNRTGVRYMGPPGSSGVLDDYNDDDDDNTDDNNENDDGEHYDDNDDANLLKVYYCPIIPMTDEDSMPTFTATLPIIRWILIREKIDIVHSHQATSVLANESVVIGTAMNLKCVYTDHSLFGFNDVASVILNRVLQTTLSTLDHAICVSNTCRDNLILRAHLDPQRVSVIPNAIDPSKFTPAPATTTSDTSKQQQQQHPIISNNNNIINKDKDNDNDNERIKIVVVSRLVFRKGIDLLVGIIPHVCRELDNVDFIIAGDGNKLLNLKELVEKERLQHRVEFLGSVQHVQVRSVLIRGNIFLNCSLTESFCIAILEAACCGLLVVSTRVGGVPEVLPHDMCLLPQPNVPEIVESVKLAVSRLANPETAVDPWKNHERLKRMYSWHRVAEQTTKVYDRIMEQESRTLLDRLKCYRSLEGFAGLVGCLLCLTLELWLTFVTWWQPAELIDEVPDLMPPRPRKESIT